MSTSIFEKVRLFTLGNIHQLLNAVIDLNSIAAIEQHVRDLDNALEGLLDEAAETEGAKRTATRLRDQKQGEVNGLTASIQAILTDGNQANDGLATGLAAKLLIVKKSLDLLNTQVQDAVGTDTAIDGAVEQMKLRIQTMGGRLDYLRQLDTAAKAKARAATSLKNAAGVMTSDSGVDVDDVEARLRNRAETAGVQLEQAMSTMTDAASNTDTAEAEALVAQMKQELGLNEASKPKVPDTILVIGAIQA